MDLTISIQTYNRSEILKETLMSLLNLKIPNNITYEILVIDNNSTDDTQKIVNSLKSDFKGILRCEIERTQGLSFARNRAIKEAYGDIIAFLDDDVEVDAFWMINILKCFNETEAALVGGKSYLIYNSERPVWLSDNAEIFLSKLDYGDERIVGIDNELAGLNYVILRDVAAQLNGFNTNLGRVGKKLLSGEEAELQKRVSEIGGLIVYEPDAVVGHKVQNERLERKWFEKRVYYGPFSEFIISGYKDVKLIKIVVKCIRGTGSYYRSLLYNDCDEKTLFDKKLYSIKTYGRVVAYLNYLLKKRRYNAD